jgi:hypothetical protein
MKSLPKTKSCKDCKQVKVIGAFYVCKVKYTAKSGVRQYESTASYCKICHSKRNHNYFGTKAEEVQKYLKDYYQKNKKKIIENQRIYRQKNREKINDRRKVREANKLLSRES